MGEISCIFQAQEGSLSLTGISYKFRVRALNMLGESEPSAPSRPYVVSGYSGRVYERPVAGPYITFTDAVNETTIMLKWMVSCLITNSVEMFLLTFCL